MLLQGHATQHYSDVIQHFFSTRGYGRHFFPPQVFPWSRLNDHNVDQHAKGEETPIEEVVADQLSGRTKSRAGEETSEMKQMEMRGKY